MSAPSPHVPTVPLAIGQPKTRQLVFEGSVALAIQLEPAEVPAGSERSIESYFIQAPRNTYLSLLLPQVRRHLLEVVLDEKGAAACDDESVWFEAGGEPWRWHWPVGLLYDYHCATVAPPAPSHGAALTLTLHLHSPPADRLPVGPSIEACRVNFMNMVKEADYLRWGSTRRVTALRKTEQDALWEGVVEHDFDKYWSVAVKLIPPPSAPGRPTALSSREATTFSVDAKLPDANAVRSIPLRIYLPDGAPVLQDLVPPMTTDGRPSHLYDVLSHHLPLIFPPFSQDMAASFLAPRPLGGAVVQGIWVPFEVEVGWLGSVLCGADGWVACVVQPRAG